MGVILANVTISNPADRTRRWEGEFLIDTGAIDTVVPGRHLRAIGIQVLDTRRYAMADGRVSELDVGVATVEFMGGPAGVTVVFADDNVRPLLGATAMESLGIEIDMSTEQLRRLPAVHL